MAVSLFDDICADAYAFDKIGPQICNVFPASFQSKFDLCPWIVNSILAIELSLKAMLINQGKAIKEIHTHDLNALFKMLIPSYRSEILNRTIKLMPELKVGDEFNSMLDKHKNYFEEERYPYEHYELSEGSLTFISALKRACVSYIQSLQNEKLN